MLSDCVHRRVGVGAVHHAAGDLRGAGTPWHDALAADEPGPRFGPLEPVALLFEALVQLQSDPSAITQVLALAIREARVLARLLERLVVAQPAQDVGGFLWHGND